MNQVNQSKSQRRPYKKKKKNKGYPRNKKVRQN